MTGHDEESVIRANADFYTALELASLEGMDRVWLHEDWVRCVHPGWDLLMGWHRVRESWEMIFDSQNGMKVATSNVWVRIIQDLAWVTCTENITLVHETSFDSVQAVATNMFVWKEDRWLMTHHHASPVPMLVPDLATGTIQ